MGRATLTDGVTEYPEGDELQPMPNRSPNPLLLAAAVGAVLLIVALFRLGQTQPHLAGLIGLFCLIGAWFGIRRFR